ncbi:MAG: VOC family protein [Rhizobiales bacterium]|nr:VOC family protein [Hyphomicrobiales bacterium]
MIGARDLPKMMAFYHAVLAPLGLRRHEEPAEAGPAGIIWQRPGRRWPQFALRTPLNGLPATCGNGVQISFAAASPDIVEAAWHLALQHGGTDEGAPGLRPRYNDDFFAAYCRDPEGNKLCFVHANALP